jgi:hypothetical protein
LSSTHPFVHFLGCCTCLGPVACVRCEPVLMKGCFSWKQDEGSYFSAKIWGTGLSLKSRRTLEVQTFSPETHGSGNTCYPVSNI